MTSIILRKPGLVDYQLSYRAMAAFTSLREAETVDEIWCLQHPAVYTLGLAGKAGHIHNAGAVPVIRTDRGGQVTYHGPGQLLIYLLLDLRRRKIGIKDYVYLLEQSLMDYLGEQGLPASRRPGAPGVYIDGRKIAALGIRVRRGCCYHGLALNVDMDISPFTGIDPCGYPGLAVTQLAELMSAPPLDEVVDGMLGYLLRNIVGEPCHIIYKPDLADVLRAHAAA